MFERLAFAALAALFLTPLALCAVAPLAYVASAVTGAPGLDAAAMNALAFALSFGAAFKGVKAVLA